MQELPTIQSNDAACCSPGTASQDPGWCAGADVDEVAAELIETAQLFRTLGDPTRLAILRQLRAQEEVCACDFVACCDVAQPTVSHHLKVLREAGLVSAEKRGIWMYYHLASGALERLRWLVP